MLVAGQMRNHRLLFEVYKGRTWLISASLDEEVDQLKEQIFWRVTRDKPKSKRKKKVGWMITIGPNPWDGSPVAASGPTISALRFIQNYNVLFYLLCMPRQM